MKSVLLVEVGSVIWCMKNSGKLTWNKRAQGHRAVLERDHPKSKLRTKIYPE